MRKDRGIINFIILLSIIIVILTVYFCLDVFGIIQVPEKFSIASFFYSKIEVLATGEIYDSNIVPENNTNVKKQNTVSKNDEEEKTENIIEEVPGEIADPLAVLNEAENKNPRPQEENNSTNNYNDSDSDFFYYQQLDQYGKIIYDTLRSDMDKLKTGTYTAEFDLEFNDLLHEENGTEILNNSFQLAINALTFDNPELFYIDITKMYLLTEITTRAFLKTYRVSIGSNGSSYLSSEFADEEAVNLALEQVQKVKDDIISRCNDLDTVDKIKLVHDYLFDTVDYDANAGENIYNIYGTLIKGRAVCEGYARTGKYILDDMNIPCIIACGTGTNNAGMTESHAWNYIKIDDKWYALDITWDDPVITGGGKLSEEKKYDYFLNGSDKFFIDHFEDGNIVGESNFKYPILSTSNY